MEATSEAPQRPVKIVVGKRLGLAHNGPRVAGSTPPEWLLNQSGPAAEQHAVAMGAGTPASAEELLQLAEQHEAKASHRDT